MYILAVSSSPRILGNTDILLDEFIRGLRETWAGQNRKVQKNIVEKIRLSGMRISPCLQCDFCQKGGCCAIDDDMQSIYPKIIAADGLILASPIYFMAHCAQAKLLIDRCQVFWSRRYILKQSLLSKDRPKRSGIFISVGATHGSKVFAGAKTTMKWFFDAIEMDYWADLLYEGQDQKGIIRNHPTALADSFLAGCKAAEEWG